MAQTAPLDLIGHFGFKSGRDMDKYKTVDYKQGVTGAPVLTNHIVSFIEAEVVDSIDVETHTIFIGKVVSAEVVSSEEPMTYAYYQQVKRGATPPAATTHIKEEKAAPAATNEKKVDGKMKKYQCSVCAYVYDPAQGDPDSGIAPGTAFEDIPDDWVCPVCGVSKDQFEPVE